MKEQTNQIRTKSDGLMDTANYKLSVKDQAHIISLLRDRLYSDKVLAVLREYSANAVDANVEAGRGDEPIKVTLPTRFTPVLKIRDHGLGLSHKQMFETFLSFGESTKRDTNDSIGQLGLGCKSGHAYSQQFSVVTYYDGVCSTYTSYIDESNCGTMALIDKRPMKADEHTGLEIVIPVRAEDITTFHERAKQLFRYYPVRPEINASIPKKPDYIVEGKDWGFTSERRARNLYAIMGGIPYPIELDKCMDKFPKALQKVFRDKYNAPNIDLYMDIGDVAVAPSREALEYTGKTKVAIAKKLVTIIDSVVSEVEKSVTEAKTNFAMRAALVKTSKLYQMGFSTDDIKQTLIAKHPKLQKLHVDAINVRPMHITNKMNVYPQTNPPDTEEKVAMVAKLNGTKRGIYKDYWASTMPNEKSRLYYVDSTSAYITKIRQHSDKNDTDPILFRPMSDDDKLVAKALETFLAKYSLEGIEVITVSDLEYTPESTRTSNSAGNAKAKAKALKLTSTIASCHGSEAWTPCEVDYENETHVWAALWHYSPQRKASSKATHHDNISYSTLCKAESILKAANMMPKEIIGVKRAAVDKVPESWTHLEDLIAEAKKKLLADKDTKQAVQTIVNYEYVHGYYTRTTSATRDLDLVYLIRTYAPEYQDKIVKLYKEIQGIHTKIKAEYNALVLKKKDLEELFNFRDFKPDYHFEPPQHMITRIRGEILKKYPLLSTYTRGYDNYKVDIGNGIIVKHAYRGYAPSRNASDAHYHDYIKMVNYYNNKHKKNN